MKNIILESFNFPKQCELNQVMFKKIFYENVQMSKSMKDIFTSDVDKIYLRYFLESDSMNIKLYKDEMREYDKIAVIEVLLNNDKKTNKVAEMIQRGIPYPVILIATYENRTLLNVVHKRTNLVDDTKNTIEEMIITDWFTEENMSEMQGKFLVSIDVKGLSYSNFYRFYADIVDRVILLKASKYMGDYNDLLGKDANEVRGRFEEIVVIEKEIEELRSEIKREVHFNRRMDMNVRVKRLEEKWRGVIEKMEGYNGKFF